MLRQLGHDEPVEVGVEVGVERVKKSKPLTTRASANTTITGFGVFNLPRNRSTRALHFLRNKKNKKTYKG